jgi:predicted ArsR family transcriptional regulator
MDPVDNSSVEADTVREAVEELYEQGETEYFPDGRAVTPEAVADHLDASEMPVRYHLDGLVQERELDDRYMYPPSSGGTPPRGFVPASETHSESTQRIR